MPLFDDILSFSHGVWCCLVPIGCHCTCDIIKLHHCPAFIFCGLGGSMWATITDLHVKGPTVSVKMAVKDTTNHKCIVTTGKMNWYVIWHLVIPGWVRRLFSRSKFQCPEITELGLYFSSITMRHTLIMLQDKRDDSSWDIVLSFLFFFFFWSSGSVLH